MEVNHRCELCRLDFKDIAYYKKHLKTKRHMLRSSSDSAIIPAISCICGKLYTFQQSLYVHHKKCTIYINSKTAPKYPPAILKVPENVLLQLQTEKDELREKLISYEKKQEEREKQYEEMRAQITLLMENKATSNKDSHNNTNSHNNIET